jgi:hypothetical protein
MKFLWQFVTRYGSPSSLGRGYSGSEAGEGVDNWLTEDGGAWLTEDGGLWLQDP